MPLGDHTNACSRHLPSKKTAPTNATDKPTRKVRQGSLSRARIVKDREGENSLFLQTTALEARRTSAINRRGSQIPQPTKAVRLQANQEPVRTQSRIPNQQLARLQSKIPNQESVRLQSKIPDQKPQSTTSNPAPAEPVKIGNQEPAIVQAKIEKKKMTKKPPLAPAPKALPFAPPTLGIKYPDLTPMREPTASLLPRKLVPSQKKLSNNPQLCTEYAAEILEYLQWIEVRCSPVKHCCPCNEGGEGDTNG